MKSSITPIVVDNPTVYAFEIRGHVTDDDMEAMAETMNAAFDAHEGKVDMLLVFEGFQGSDRDVLFDWDVMKAQFRSLSKVDRYVVVGAPQRARSMIERGGALSPVDTYTFDSVELDKAYRLLDTSPLQSIGPA